MLLAQAVVEVSQWFGLPLHGFGQPHYAVPKQSVYGQIQRYQKNIPALIRNFSNLCKRSALVYFDMKPPSDDVQRNLVFFPQAMITGDILTKINSSAVVTYLYLWMLKMEQAIQNRFKFELPTVLEVGKDLESKGFRISRKSIYRHVEQLNALRFFDKFTGPIL